MSAGGKREEREKDKETGGFIYIYTCGSLNPQRTTFFWSEVGFLCNNIHKAF